MNLALILEVGLAVVSIAPAAYGTPAPEAALSVDDVCSGDSAQHCASGLLQQQAAAQRGIPHDGLHAGHSASHKGAEEKRGSGHEEIGVSGSRSSHPKAASKDSFGDQKATSSALLTHDIKTNRTKQEACDDSLADNSCENRRQACESGSDKAQCDRCVYKIYCEGDSSFTGVCYGRGVTCPYVAGVQLGTYCFPSAATVRVLAGPGAVASVRMKDLKVGDRVLTAGGFSEVYAFMDHTAAPELEYVRLKTASGAKLSLTGEHVVFAHEDRQPVLAAEVEEGDFLWVVDEASELGIEKAPLQLSRVVAVSRRRAKGAHAPLTAEGSLVVDGVLASSSAGLKTLRWGGLPLLTGHRAVMLLHAPLRFVCRLAPSACGPDWHSAELGRHAWTQWLLDHLGWLRRMNLLYDDLRAHQLSVEAWAAALTQLLMAATLACLDAVIFSLSPWQALAVLGLCGLKGMQYRSMRKAAL